MMQQMRDNTKWIMLITALAFVALMVFEWGMDMSGGSAAQFTGGQIGSVNGQAITYQEFSQVYRNLYEQRQQQGTSVSNAENEQIEDEAWDQLVMDRLIEQELRRREIRVTDAEIRQAARYAPPPEFYQYELFQTDGQFDIAKYHQFLSSGSADVNMLRDLEAYYRRVIPRSKLFQSVGAAMVVTDGELWRLYRERNETASIRYLALDPRQMVGDAEVTVEEREISAYYNEQRNNFQRPARAEVQAVSVDKTPTAADTAASLERAREVRAQILDGADFAEMAAAESSDPGSASQGGALGTIRRDGQMVQPFEDAVWNARVGTVTEPVLTQFGYHLIRVDERTAEEADVSHILIPIERTLESEDAMLARVDSLEDLVERMALRDAAEALGLSVRTTELTPLIPSIPGVGSLEEGVDWVFEDRPVRNEVSPVFENERSFYVLELVEREEERTLTLEEARASIRTILANQKKRDRARDIGLQAVEQIRAGASLDEAAQTAGLTVREAGPFTRLDFVPGIGSGNAAVGAAFGMEIGERSGLIETPEAFYVIEVTDRTPADREAWQAQKDRQRQQVQAALQNQRVQQFLEGLREEAEVQDDRDRVLQPATTATS